MIRNFSGFLIKQFWNILNALSYCLLFQNICIDVKYFKSPNCLPSRYREHRKKIQNSQNFQNCELIEIGFLCIPCFFFAHCIVQLQSINVLLTVRCFVNEIKMSNLAAVTWNKGAGANEPIKKNLIAILCFGI